MRKIIFLKNAGVLLIVLVMVLSTVSIVAGNSLPDELDQQAPDQSLNGGNLRKDVKFAQSFTPTMPVLTRIELVIFTPGPKPTSDLLVSIRSSLNGIDLTSVYVSPSVLPHGGYNMPWTELDFLDISVTPGQKYYIMIHASPDYDISTYRTVGWHQSSNTYLGGEAWVNYYNGQGWEQTSPRDWCFKTYGLSSNWPMFQRDIYHSGHLPINAPDTNNVKWTADTGGIISHSSPVVANGKVYVGSTNKNVSCLDAETGEFIWNFTTGLRIQSTPAVCDGYVYVGSDDERMYCLNANTGAVKWIHPTYGKVRSSPCVVNGYVYFGSEDKNIYCLKAPNGVIKWKKPLDQRVEYSSPAFYNNSVYITSYSGSIYRFNATTGDLIWHKSHGANIIHSPTIYDGMIYFAGLDYRIWCLNADNGDPIYASQIGNNDFWASPAINDGKIYIGCEDQQMYCVNAYTGNVKWAEPIGEIVFSSPAVADGKVYIGLENGNFYCLDANNGNKVWTYQTGIGIYTSPAVAYGKVYIGSDKLYCFADKNTIIKGVGTLTWPDIQPGSTATGSFTVENIGDPGSLMDWEIESYPGWGTWTITPSSGNDLTPEDGPTTVEIEVIAPDDQNQQFDGEIKIVNNENPYDFDIIDITLTTPKNKATYTMPLFLQFLNNHPNLFPIIRYILGLQ